MNSIMIKEKLKILPDNLEQELLDFMDFLIQKYGRRKNQSKKFKFDWEGGLSDLKEKFTSVDLQHKASEWR